MKIVEKTISVPRTELVETVVKNLVTSDGREWNIGDQERASKWEEHLKEVNDFKKLINYKDFDYKDFLWRHNMYEFNKSFTFDWPEGLLLDKRMLNLQKVYSGYSLRDSVYSYSNILTPGKYICIEYVKDLHDSPSYYGFFGLVDDYISSLEKDLDYITQEIKQIKL